MMQGSNDLRLGITMQYRNSHKRRNIPANRTISLVGGNTVPVGRTLAFEHIERNRCGIRDISWNAIFQPDTDPEQRVASLHQFHCRTNMGQFEAAVHVGNCRNVHRRHLINQPACSLDIAKRAKALHGELLIEPGGSFLTK